jgi:Zn-dependent alcohol dehydrogenase
MGAKRPYAESKALSSLTLLNINTGFDRLAEGKAVRQIVMLS